MKRKCIETNQTIERVAVDGEIVEGENNPYHVTDIVDGENNPYHVTDITEGELPPKNSTIRHAI